jgi:hypothetical protein
MTINFTDIDENFPVPGVDNNSQGFRDNFSLIKSGLGIADSAIADLQSKVILKAALADTELDNNMNGNSIANAVFEGCSTNAIPETTISDANYDISYNVGAYQNLRVESNVDLRVINWPAANTYAKLILQLSSDDVHRTVDLSTASNVGGSLTAGDVYYSSNWPATLSINDANIYTIVECWSADGGATMFANYIGQFDTTPGP